ncbi:hypothetical protein Btru_021311 [Bulinus truncatus]|nr:hypothetical protein Btru_021311 [Bulinus truncatus]
MTVLVRAMDNLLIPRRAMDNLLILVSAMDNLLIPMRALDSLVGGSVNCNNTLDRFDEYNNATNINPPLLIEWAAELNGQVIGMETSPVMLHLARVHLVRILSTQLNSGFRAIQQNLPLVQSESKIINSPEDLHSQFLTSCINDKGDENILSEISLHVSVISDLSEQPFHLNDVPLPDAMCIVYIIIVLSAALMVFVLFQKGRRVFKSLKDETGKRKPQKVNSDLPIEEILSSVDVQERCLMLNFEPEEITEYINFQSTVNTDEQVDCRKKSKRLNYIEVEINRETKVPELTDEGHPREPWNSVEYSTIDKVATLKLARQGNNVTTGDAADGRWGDDDDQQEENVYSNTKTVAEEIVLNSSKTMPGNVDYVDNNDKDSRIDNEGVVEEIPHGATSELQKSSTSEMFQYVPFDVSDVGNIDGDRDEEGNVYTNSKAVLEEILRVTSMEILELMENVNMDPGFGGESIQGHTLDDNDDLDINTTSNTSDGCGRVTSAGNVDSANSEDYGASESNVESSLSSFDPSENEDYASEEARMNSSSDREFEVTDSSQLVSVAADDKNEELDDSIYGNIKDINNSLKENISKMLLDKL